GTLWPAYRDRAGRAIRRNLAAFAAIYLTWLLTGDGMIRGMVPSRDEVVDHNGMSIDRRDEAELYAFIETLPVDARIALHPGDGAGVSYWTGRATTEHHETLQPWLVEPWRRTKTRTTDSLRALYDTDAERVLRYCDYYDVSHLLIRTSRYGEKWRTNAALWPPFDDYITKLVEQVDRDDLVIPNVTARATVYYQQPWVVLDVERMRRAVAATERSGDLSQVTE
ncbi:MAG: hypothetical protein ACYSW1_14040, partial [Planctomycetota bacterium]